MKTDGGSLHLQTCESGDEVCLEEDTNFTIRLAL